MKRRKRSIVWRYFKKVHVTGGTQCTLCGQEQEYPKKTTWNMLSHLKRDHKEVMNETVKTAVKNSNKNSGKLTAQRRKNTKSVRSAKSSKSNQIQVKQEIICTINEDMENDEVTVSTSTIERSPPTTHQEITSSNHNPTNPNHQGEDAGEPNVFSNISSTSCTTISGRNFILNNQLKGIATDLKCIQRSLSWDTDHFFFAIAAELKNMSEECRDLMKAATWRIICEVKRAKRSNEKLSVDDLFK